MGLGRVSLVRKKRRRGRTWPTTAEPRDPELAQKHRQCGGVFRLAGREHQHQGQASAINERVGLGCQASSGAPNSAIVRFVPATQQIFVIRESPLCER